MFGWIIHCQGGCGKGGSEPGGVWMTDWGLIKPRIAGIFASETWIQRYLRWFLRENYRIIN